MAAKLMTKRTTWAVMQVNVSLPAGLVEEDDEDDEDDCYAACDPSVGGNKSVRAGSQSRSASSGSRLTQLTPPPPPTHQQSQQLVITVDLWVAEALTAVLRVDTRGRVADIHEPACRPAALLFGLAHAELVGDQLARMLQLPPGKSVASLQQAGPKSSLKTAAGGPSKGDTAGKVRRSRLAAKAGADAWTTCDLDRRKENGQPFQAEVLTIGVA
jgi:hypothetical protein